MKRLFFMFTVILCMAACESDDNEREVICTFTKSDLDANMHYTKGTNFFVQTDFVIQGKCPRFSGTEFSDITATNSEEVASVNNAESVICSGCGAIFSYKTGQALNDKGKGLHLHVYKFDYNAETETWTVYR